MSFVRIDLTKTKEPEIVPEGEYDLRIIKVVEGETKKKKPMTVLTLKIENSDVPNPAPFQHFIVHPDGGDYDEMRMLEMKRILTMFEVPFDAGGFDMEQLLGQTGRCLVVQEEGDDQVIRNRMKLPRLKE